MTETKSKPTTPKTNPLALRVKILDVLDSEPAPISARELAEELAARGVSRNLGSVHRALAALISSGEVVRFGCKYATRRQPAAETTDDRRGGL